IGSTDLWNVTSFGAASAKQENRSPQTIRRKPSPSNVEHHSMRYHAAMNRRTFVGALALAPLARAADPPSINGERLREHIERLSVFGRPAGGTFADGVSRVAYSDADIAGRRYAMGLMEAAGLTPKIDAAGNISAVRAGTDRSLPPVLFGSHIDSVPNGGNFDGDLGSLAAIE